VIGLLLSVPSLIFKILIVAQRRGSRSEMMPHFLTYEMISSLFYPLNPFSILELILYDVGERGRATK
jgi:hypothetical protein